MFSYILSYLESILLVVIVLYILGKSKVMRNLLKKFKGVIKASFDTKHRPESSHNPKNAAVSEALALLGYSSEWWWVDEPLNIICVLDQEGGNDLSFEVVFSRSNGRLIVDSIIPYGKEPIQVKAKERTVDEAYQEFYNELCNNAELITDINNRIDEYNQAVFSVTSLTQSKQITKNEMLGMKKAFEEMDYSVVLMDYQKGSITLTFQYN